MKTAILLLGLWLITIGLCVNQFRIAANLRQDLANAREAMEIMQRQHEGQLEALANAQTTRDKIHEQATTLRRQLDTALALHSDFADLPLPDSLRRQLATPDHSPESFD